MKKVLLVILLLASIFYFVDSRYDFVSGRTPNGEYTLVMVDTANGKTYQLMGQ